MNSSEDEFDPFADDRPKKKKRKLVNSSEDESSDIKLEHMGSILKSDQE